MALQAIETLMSGATSVYPLYDQTKINIGQWIKSTYASTALGPQQICVGRPMEESTANQCFVPWIVQWTSDVYYVFLADATGGAATRKIYCYKYVISNNTLSFQGFVTLTFPTGGTHTIRGFAVEYRTYNTGTISSVSNASPSIVAGSSTAWTTAGLAGGARIGFGSALDPSAIPKWYYIAQTITTSGIASDTSITLSGNAPSFSGVYMIEELRIIVATTNGTVAQSGLFVAKGLTFDDFALAGTTIAAGTTFDNTKAVYWLQDNATMTNTAACGIGYQTAASATSQTIYVANADTTTSLKIFQYNVRIALGVMTTGTSALAFVQKTGAQAVTGTLAQIQSWTLANLSHGPGNGVLSMYGLTASRVLRCPTTGSGSAYITSGSTTFIVDTSTEWAPGKILQGDTFATTGGMSSIAYADTIDRLAIFNGSGQRSYVTQYSPTGGNPPSTGFDHVMFLDSKQLDKTTSFAMNYHPSNTGFAYTGNIKNGMAFVCRSGTAVDSNILYGWPLGAHWTYAYGVVALGQNRLVTPVMNTTGAKKFYRVYVNFDRDNWIQTGDFGAFPEPYRIFYRTSGISDNTGTWLPAGPTRIRAGNLTSVTAASTIQFMIEFRTIGMTCIPNSIFNVCVLYEDGNTDSHFEPSVYRSSISERRFAWRFENPFETAVPTLNISIVNADSGSVLLTDSTVASANGTWGKSTDDGANFIAYGTLSDKANETTYIRYTPTSPTFGDNTRVKAILTQ